MDMILRIDMGAEGGPRATTEEMGKYAGLGGRAMTSLIEADEVDPMCHPLGAGNKLVFAPGMLTGSAASTSGRISVGCKSPLTGGIKEANDGGQAGQAFARLGYRAVIIEGKPAGDAQQKVQTKGQANAPKADAKEAKPPKEKAAPPGPPAADRNASAAAR